MRRPRRTFTSVSSRRKELLLLESPSRSNVITSIRLRTRSTSFLSNALFPHVISYSYYDFSHYLISSIIYSSSLQIFFACHHFLWLILLFLLYCLVGFIILSIFFIIILFLYCLSCYNLLYSSMASSSTSLVSSYLPGCTVLILIPWRLSLTSSSSLLMSVSCSSNWLCT